MLFELFLFVICTGTLADCASLGISQALFPGVVPDLVKSLLSSISLFTIDSFFFFNLSQLLSEQTWALSVYSTLICLKFSVQVISGINVSCNCGFHVWVISLNLWCIFTVDSNIFDISCFSFLLSQLEMKIRQPFLVGEHDYIPGVVRLGHGTYWLQLQIISWFLRCVCVCVCVYVCS